MTSSVIFQDQTHAMTQLSSQPSTEHPEINWRPRYNPLIVHLPLFFVDLWIFRIEELPISTSESNDLSYPISHHDATNQAKWTYTDTYPFQIIFSKSNFTSNHGTTCLHLKDSHGCRDRKPMTSPGMPWPATPAFCLPQLGEFLFATATGLWSF